ncbi:MAG: DUF429 domain-containing protein [Calditrichaceae bacterium]
MRFVGVDGCRAGWIAAGIDTDFNGELKLFPELAMLWDEFRESSMILIDIPIGLPSSRARECDILARKILKSRPSSIFPAPCRDAVYAANYRDASLINQKTLGKKLSVQTWNIIPKIRQTDILLSSQGQARIKIHESHPEICFQSLNGQPLKNSKKTIHGVNKRLQILNNIQLSLPKIYNTALSRFKRSDVARDDILDALILAVTAASPPEMIKSIPEHPDKDAYGFPMEILYPDSSSRF